MATSSVSGSTRNATSTPKAPLTPIANADSRTCPAGHGTRSPTSGRRVSADSCDYVERHGDARVPDVLHRRWLPARCVGPARNAPTTPEAPLTPTANADSRTCPAGHGTPRRPVGGGLQPTPATTSNATVTPASRSPTRSMATSSVSGSIVQRTRHRKGTLDADRQRRLEDLPGWTWDPTPTSGRRVSADSRTTSNATVTPASRTSYTVDGYQLGHWVNTQRSIHAKGILDADREHRLEDLPGWTWDPHGRPVGGGFPPTPALRRTPR